MVYPYSGIYLANIEEKKKSNTLYNIGNNFQGVFLREEKNKSTKCIAYLPFVYKK